MRKELNKKQHYIPQCYLKGFANDKNVVYVYSKKLEKIYQKSISNIAYEDYFYRIPEDQLIKENCTDPDYYEKYFFAEHIEPQFAAILNSIIEKSLLQDFNGPVLSQYEKDIFSALIAIQYLRLPQTRNKYFSVLQKLNQQRTEIIKSILIQEFPDKKKLVDTFILYNDEKQKSSLHADVYAYEELINDIQDILLEKIWIFKTTNYNIFTSDNPIVVYPHIDGQTQFFDGLGMKGGEVIFPINHAIVLSMLDSAYFCDQQCNDNKFIKIDKSATEIYNCYQYMYFKKELYSKVGGFDEKVPYL